jgi:hypothetical protein
MAKIKMLTSMAGINFVHNAGDVIDVTDDQAVRFVGAGIAEAVEGPKTKVEQATSKPKVETAVKKD